MVNCSQQRELYSLWEMTSSGCDLGPLAAQADQWCTFAVQPWGLSTVAKWYRLQFATRPPTFNTVLTSIANGLHTLCPVLGLSVYVERTAGFRRTDQLFVSWSEGGAPSRRDVVGASVVGHTKAISHSETPHSIIKEPGIMQATLRF